MPLEREARCHNAVILSAIVELCSGHLTHLVHIVRTASSPPYTYRVCTFL